MKIIIYFFGLFFSMFVSAQQANSDDILTRLPVKDGLLFYEKVFTIDSTIRKDKIFNSAKQSLIKSTSYKYSKIDEDRVSGSISTEINYIINSKPGIARINLLCRSTLSIDCKDGKFRIQVYNSSAEYAGISNTAQSYYDFCIDPNTKENKKRGRKELLHDMDHYINALIQGLKLTIEKNFKDDDF